MVLMKKLHDAFNAKDLETLDKLMADDFVFVRHQSGTEVTKAEMLGWDRFKPAFLQTLLNSFGNTMFIRGTQIPALQFIPYNVFYNNTKFFVLYEIIMSL